MKLSGPKFFNIFSNIVTAPLPDTGERSVSGITSGGIPTAFATGDKSSQSTERPPEALSILTAVISAIKGGVMERAVLKPLFAPSKKTSNIFTPLIAPNVKIPTAITGKIQSVIYDTLYTSLKNRFNRAVKLTPTKSAASDVKSPGTSVSIGDALLYSVLKSATVVGTR